MVVMMENCKLEGGMFIGEALPIKAANSSLFFLFFQKKNKTKFEITFTPLKV